MASRLGIEVGGTFTTLLLIDDSGAKQHLIKTRSTPEDETAGIIAGLQRLIKKTGISAAQIGSVICATAYPAHTILAGKGAKVGLLVTENFEQILHLARSQTPAALTGWMAMDAPVPLADLETTRGIKERIAANGEVLTGLDEKQARAAIQELLDAQVDAIAVSLLHAYANPEHEKLLQALIGELNADMPVICSFDSAPEPGEYERTLTTVMNACAQPGTRKHLHDLGQKLSAHQLSAQIAVARGDGGMMNPQHAVEFPVHTALSGAAGSAGGAAFVAGLAAYPEALAFDMGGTSSTIALLQKARPVISRQTPLGAYTLNIPAVEAHYTGAGSSAIARVPAGGAGALSVGPSGAGATPGPACYGHGGENATIADANIVLGRLPSTLLDGTMNLDIDAAGEAVAKIGRTLDLDVYQTAQGIVDIANEYILGALRLVSAQKGVQTGDLALIAAGGAGPLHANAIAALGGCYPVIVPPLPAGLSALGLLCSPVKHEFTRTVIRPVDAIGAEQLLQILSQLGDKAQKWLADEGVKAHDQTIKYETDMRYSSQKHLFTLPLDPARLQHEDDALADIRERFQAACARRYPVRLDTVPEIAPEIVTVRAIGLGRDGRAEINPPKQTAGSADSAMAISGQRRVYFDGKPINTPIYKRALLSAGNRIDGPAVIEQEDATTVIHPAHTGEVDEYGNLLIREDFNEK